MKIYLVLTMLIFSFMSRAQQKNYEKDVTSPDAITESLYAVISGEAGQPRDWDRFRNLFKLESRLIPTRKGEGGELIIKSLTPEEYITLFNSRVSTGFFERKIHNVTETYGTVTHTFSTYETKEKKMDLSATVASTAFNCFMTVSGTMSLLFSGVLKAWDSLCPRNT